MAGRAGVVIELPDPPPGARVRVVVRGEAIVAALGCKAAQAASLVWAFEFAFCLALIGNVFPLLLDLLTPGHDPQRGHLELTAAALLVALLALMLVSSWLVRQLFVPELVELTKRGLEHLAPARTLSSSLRARLGQAWRVRGRRPYLLRASVPRASITGVRLVGPDFGGHVALDHEAGSLGLGGFLFVADREWLYEVIRRWLADTGGRSGEAKSKGGP
jgi:hypothetical protein